MAFRLFILAMALSLPVSMIAKGSPAPQKKSHAQQQNKQDSVSKSDKMFLKALIQEDISEIGLAKMALQKSSNPDVKQYAQTKILAADPQMRDGAEKIAQDNGMQPPTQPNARQKKMYDKLSQKSGKLFDNAYMNYEATQQTNDVKLANAELGSTHSSVMKSYLDNEKTPIVKAAASAKKISQTISSGMTHYQQQATKQGGARQHR
jgi:putative membrane protein